jgi:hypothetical protein
MADFPSPVGKSGDLLPSHWQSLTFYFDGYTDVKQALAGFWIDYGSSERVDKRFQNLKGG